MGGELKGGAMQVPGKRITSGQCVLEKKIFFRGGGEGLGDWVRVKEKGGG